MDGNGRWAELQGLPRIAGHQAGTAALRRVVEAAPSMGIRTLTLFAFSSDNWKRPRAEVDALMTLLVRHFETESVECAGKGVRISMIGRRDRLPEAVVRAACQAERLTRECRRLHLRMAIDYSGRDAILSATEQSGPRTREGFSSALGDDVDLLIRSGGERRLSDFLIWECAYAELVFTDRMWPDFDASDLAAAVRDFQSRERRFGGAAHQAPLGQLWTRDEPGSLHHLRRDRWLR